jgi:antitoxin ParD1/3/4
VVETGGLENRLRGDSHGGSNPSSSARTSLLHGIKISLPESLCDFIDQQVKTKGFWNVSEYFRGLLRNAQEEEEKKQLEALLLEGLETGGDDMVVDKAFWSDVREATAVLISKHQKKK